MGGNIWDTSQRLTADEYNTLCTQFTDAYRVIPSYYSKESFGDLDALHSGTDKEADEFMFDNFNVVSQCRTKNSQVKNYQIELKDGKRFQVDLIYCPGHELEFSYRYFAWNDCGNLIGRIARRVGLKFGHNGLFYVQRDSEDRVIQEHLLTLDFDRALKYLDLDPEKHKSGFDTPEDIYKFIVASKYFDYGSVDLSQRNYRARVRDKKRVMYTNFMSWLAENNLTEYNTNLPEKAHFLKQHFDAFPEFFSEYHATLKLAEEQKAKKQKFNGEIVSELTGLSGQELGMFIALCKKEPWHDIILDLSQHDINRRIKSLYNSVYTKDY